MPWALKGPETNLPSNLSFYFSFISSTSFHSSSNSSFTLTSSHCKLNTYLLSTNTLYSSYITLEVKIDTLPEWVLDTMKQISKGRNIVSFLQKKSEDRRNNSTIRFILFHRRNILNFSYRPIITPKIICAIKVPFFEVPISTNYIVEYKKKIHKKKFFTCLKMEY